MKLSRLEKVIVFIIRTRKTHEFLRGYTDIFTKNVYATKDFTYSNLQNIIKNDKLVVLSGDKDSCVVIIQREEYDMKLQNMIDDVIRKGNYSPTSNC